MNEHKVYLPSKENFSEYTLFLDRDGVINKPRIADYAKKPEEFELIDGALEAIEVFNNLFQKVIIVTNQQGIHRGLMSETDLENVHLKFYNALKEKGINYPEAVFFAPYLKTEQHNWRKPKVGMPTMAQTYFPTINFKKSIMVGDSDGDMKLADNMGSIKVKILNPQFNFNNQDLEFSSLWQFAEHLTKM
jgi:histidinol-phosphate phosphatase family protein